MLYISVQFCPAADCLQSKALKHLHNTKPLKCTQTDVEDVNFDLTLFLFTSCSTRSLCISSCRLLTLPSLRGNSSSRMARVVLKPWKYIKHFCMLFYGSRQLELYLFWCMNIYSYYSFVVLVAHGWSSHHLLAQSFSLSLPEECFRKFCTWNFLRKLAHW